MSDVIRDFPREVSRGIWPTLEPTSEDKRYQPLAQVEAHRQWLLRREKRRLLLIDTLEALVKGAILGGVVFVLVYGLVLNLPFWLPGWHWVFGIAGIVLLIFLIGSQGAMLVVFLGVAIVAVFEIVRNPSLLLLLLTFIAAGTTIRGLIELFPTKIA